MCVCDWNEYLCVVYMGCICARWGVCGMYTVCVCGICVVCACVVCVWRVRYIYVVCVCVCNSIGCLWCMCGVSVYILYMWHV